MRPNSGNVKKNVKTTESAWQCAWHLSFHYLQCCIYMYKTKILHFHHGNYCRAASKLYAKYTAISHTEKLYRNGPDHTPLLFLWVAFGSSEVRRHWASYLLISGLSYNSRQLATVGRYMPGILSTRMSRMTVTQGAGLINGLCWDPFCMTGVTGYTANQNIHFWRHRSDTIWLVERFKIVTGYRYSIEALERQCEQGFLSRKSEVRKYTHTVSLRYRDERHRYWCSSGS